MEGVFMQVSSAQILSQQDVNFHEYAPGFSTARGLYQIFHAHVQPSTDHGAPLKKHTYTLLSGERSWRSFIMLLPIIGNIILLILDKLLFIPADENLFLQNDAQLADPHLQKFLDEMRSLSKKNFQNSIPYMKDLKMQWEKLYNDILHEQSADENRQKLLSIAKALFEKAAKKVVALKKEKHLQEAGPLRNATHFYQIQSQAMSGNEKAVKAFIKLGQEEKEVQKIKQSRSPLSLAAQEMSLLLKMLQQNMNSLTFSLDKKTNKYVAADSEGKILCQDFQKLLRSVDWSQVSLDKDKGIIFSNLRAAMQSSVSLPASLPNQEITNEEKYILQKDYILDGFTPMNKLLRGDFSSFTAEEAANINATLKINLLKVAKLICGLCKLPDYQGASKFVWRGETTNWIYPEFYVEIQRRISAIGKAPIPSFGFTSTSVQKIVKGENCITLLRNDGGGKDVRKYGISYEQEILFPPTKIQWRYYKKVFGGHLFLARTVRTY
jgi:hypothetical protein